MMPMERRRKECVTKEKRKGRKHFATMSHGGLLKRNCMGIPSIFDNTMGLINFNLAVSLQKLKVL